MGMIEKILNQANIYDLILNGMLVKLSELDFVGGTEGVAYFDGDFVLKDIIEKTDKHTEYDSKMFELYCMEMQNFATNGYAVPQIYAWTEREKQTTIRDMKNYDGSKLRPFSGVRHDYYILEERIKGTPLFDGYLNERYKTLGKNRCSESRYKRVTTNNGSNFTKSDKLLAKAILLDYLQSFINVNEMLESISESEFRTLIVDGFNMYVLGRYNEPDFYPSNIFIDEKSKFKIIDNRRDTISLRAKTDEESVQLLKIMAIAQLFDIFGNAYLMEEAIHEATMLERVDESFWTEAEPLIKKNERVLSEVMIKFVKALRGTFDKSLLLHPEMFERLTKKFDDAFTNNDREMLEIYSTFVKE